MALARIPTPLTSLTRGEREPHVSGATVAQVIEELERAYPGIAERLLDEDGNVRRFVNIYVNEEDIRFQQGLETPVAADAEVSIIPAVAGG